MQAPPPGDPAPVAPRNRFASDCAYWLAQFYGVFKQFWILVVLAVWGGLCYLLITHFIFISVQVDGQSMVPTLENSGHYWLNRLAYLRHEPQRLDIVALKDPRDQTLVVKRVIALPGESVYLHLGKVYLNGKLLPEPYLMTKTYTFAYERKSGEEFFAVGKDQYFVMGDNRNNSTDSRTFGTVPRQNILGKVIE